MKIMKIAVSNIRNRKAGACTFLIMCLLTVFMLCISLALFWGNKTLFEEKHKELKGPDLGLQISDQESRDYVRDYIEHSQDTKDYILSDIYSFSSADLIGENKENKKENISLSIFPAKDYMGSKIMPLTYIEPLEKVPAQAVVVPLGMRSFVSPGDRIQIKSGGREDQFTVYAFYEDIETGASIASVVSLYAFQDAMETLTENKEARPVYYARITLKDNEKLSDFESNLEPPTAIISLSYDQSKSRSGMFVMILSVIILAIAGVILVIALVIVRFQIVSGLAEDITNLGALKSIGFTSRQLILSQIVQYTLIVLIGGSIGMGLYVLTFPYIGNVVAGTTGLLWSTGTNWLGMFFSMAVTMFLCMALVYLVALKIKKITPINALRSGESHHSFKKNRLPLKKYKLPLGLHLALKNNCSNIKGNLTLFVVAAIMNLIMALAGVMQYNVVHPEAFYRMVGEDDVDYMLIAENSIIKELDQDLTANKDVAEIIMMTQVALSVEDITGVGIVYQDYAFSTARDLYKGRKPDAENEVALGASLAKQMGKEIGDTVSLKAFGVEKDYIIVGLTQGLATGGRGISVTLDGIRRHQADVTLNVFGVKLKAEAAKDKFEESIEKYRKQCSIINYEDTLASIFDPMGAAISTAVWMTFAVSIFVVVFILFLLIHSMIRKEKKNYGIMKACGFTNRQIIGQVLMSFLPMVFLGSCMGVLVSIFFTNDLLSLAFQMAGLNRTFFVIPVLNCVMYCGVIFITACVISILITLRIRKISAHKLIVAE